MNKTELVAGLKIIHSVFLDRFPVTDHTIEAWHLTLQHIPGKDFLKAVVAVLQEKKTPPVPADITEAYAKTKTSTLTWFEAFNLVLEAVQRYGSYSADLAIENLPPEVRIAIGGVPGFKALCLAKPEDTPFFKAQFRQAFEIQEKRALQEIQRNSLPLITKNLLAQSKIKLIP